MYAPVRGGNRGGWDQFKWDDVRLMSYKDRECYLGASERLGYLDKGGKWRKRDWWVGTKDDVNIYSFIFSFFLILFNIIKLCICL